MHLSRAFSMLEMAIVIAVIVIVSVVVYANYSEIGDQGEILGIGEKIRNHLRTTQNYSLAGKTLKGKATAGWGVYLNRNINKYTLFADLNGNKLYDYPTKLLIHGSEAPSGTTFTDSSANGNAIALVNAPTRNATGGQPTGTDDGYWTFSSAGSRYLNAGVNSNFSPVAEDFTLDLWFNPATLGSERALVSRTGSFDFYITSGSRLYFTFYDSANTPLSVASDPIIESINAGTWYHGAVVRNHGYLMLFLNGKLHALLNIGAATAMREINGSLQIGRKTGPEAYFDGSLDEIRFAKGWAAWFESFNVPTARHDADNEKFLEVKLSPGVVFEKLYKDAAAQAELHLLFSPLDHLLYVNGTSGSDATMVVNRGGLEKTGLAGDTPRAYKIWKSGLVSTTLVP